MPAQAERRTSATSAHARRAVVATSLRRIAALDHHQLDLAAAVAAERRRVPVLPGLEAGDAFLQRRELDHDEAVEFLRAFEDPVLAAAGEHLAAVLRHDCGDAVG